MGPKRFFYQNCSPFIDKFKKLEFNAFLTFGHFGPVYWASNQFRFRAKISAGLQLWVIGIIVPIHQKVQEFSIFDDKFLQRYRRGARPLTIV